MAGRSVDVVITDVVSPLLSPKYEMMLLLILYETFGHNSQCERGNSSFRAAIWTEKFDVCLF